MSNNDKPSYLTKFQQQGAKKIYDALLKTEESTSNGSTKNARRFLLSDEVGLGKTVTAAAAVAMAVNNRNNNRQMNVGYLCNNQTLAIKCVKDLILHIIKNLNEEIKNEEIKNNKTEKELVDDHKSVSDNKKNSHQGSSSSPVVSIYTMTPSTTIRVDSKGKWKDNLRAYFLADLALDEEIKKAIEGRSDFKELIQATDESRLKIFYKTGWVSFLKQGDPWQEDIKDNFKKAAKQLKDDFDKKFFETYFALFNNNGQSELKRIFDEFIFYIIPYLNRNYLQNYCNNKKMDNKAPADGSVWTNDELFEACCILDKLQISKTTSDIHQNFKKTIISKIIRDKAAEIEEKIEEKIKNEELDPEKIKYEMATTSSEAFDDGHPKRSIINRSYELIIRWIALQYVDSCKKRATAELTAVLKKIKSYADPLLKKLIPMLCKHMGDPTPDKNDIGPLDPTIKEIIPQIITQIITHLTIPVHVFSRKCIIMTEFKNKEFDLVIADEMHNYSDIIHKAIKADNDMSKQEEDKQTEIDLLVQTILSEEKLPVLLMSATPFRIYSKEKDEKKKAVKVDPSDTSSDSQKYQKKETDIYEEFLTVATYLLNQKKNEELDKMYEALFKVNTGTPSEKWQKLWDHYEKKKYHAVTFNGDIESRRKEYVDAIGCQEKMMKLINVVRTERLMSGIEMQFLTNARTLIPDDDDEQKKKIYRVLHEELLRTPKARLSPQEDYYLYCNKYKSKWYMEAENKFYPLTIRNVLDEIGEYNYNEIGEDNYNEIGEDNYNEIGEKAPDTDAYYCYSVIWEDDVLKLYPCQDHKIKDNIKQEFEAENEKWEKNIDQKDFYLFEYNGNRYLYHSDAGYILAPEDEDVDEDVYNKFKNKINEDSQKANEKGISLAYLKNTPAAFSFKESYELENYYDSTGNFTIKAERIKKFEKIFAQGDEDEEKGLLYHARMAALIHRIFDKEEQHKLLFIPPAHPKKELKGCFKKAFGVSKRLFFSEHYMTTSSLSTLLSYESERRAKEDLLKKFKNKKINIRYVPNNDTESFDPHILTRYHSYKDDDVSQYNNLILGPEKDLKYFDNIAKSLVEYDRENYRENYETGPDSSTYDGSPYAYIKSKKLTEAQEKEFCLNYFKYMLMRRSLRVMLAYMYDPEKPKSIYELILAYGAAGRIHDVFDEYIDLDNKRSIGDLTNLLGKYCENVYNSSKTIIADVELGQDFAVGAYKQMPQRKTEEIMTLFNSPFLPFQFISTSIGQEGLDFHFYCRKIVHWTLEENPLSFEQREGRINRFRSYASRLQAEMKIREMKDNQDLLKDFNWGKAFEYFQKHSDFSDYYGIAPNFIFPVNNNQYGLEREFYYYPGSYEESALDMVIRRLGYYRSLLGRHGSDTYEEHFRRFIEGVEMKDRAAYFINLSSVDLPHKSVQTEDMPDKTVLTIEQADNFCDWYGPDVKANVINNVINKKILVAEKISNGKNLLFRKAEENGMLLGIEPKKIADIALPIVAESLARQKISRDELKNIVLTPLSFEKASMIILNILHHAYPDRRQILTRNTADEVLRIVNMLRMNGCGCQVNEEGFFNIKTITDKYETFLREHHIYDVPRLLQEAETYIKALHQNGRKSVAEIPEYAFLDDHTPTKLENELIQLLNGHVTTTTVSAVQQKEDLPVRFFKSYGMLDEVLAVAKEIIEQKLNAGEVSVCYTDQAYVNIIRNVFEQFQIPVCFPDGLPACEANHIRL